MELNRLSYHQESKKERERKKFCRCKLLDDNSVHFFFSLNSARAKQTEERREQTCSQQAWCDCAPEIAVRPLSIIYFHFCSPAIVLKKERERQGEKEIEWQSRTINSSSFFRAVIIPLRQTESPRDEAFPENIYSLEDSNAEKKHLRLLGKRRRSRGNWILTQILNSIEVGRVLVRMYI